VGQRKLRKSISSESRRLNVWFYLLFGAGPMITPVMGGILGKAFLTLWKLISVVFLQ
jgi:hypothetical protein